MLSKFLGKSVISTEEAELVRRQKTVLEYLISRLELMASPADPAYFYVSDVAEKLGIVLDVPSAKKDLYEVLEKDLALSVECMLTGSAWVDDRFMIKTGALGRARGNREGGKSHVHCTCLRSSCSHRLFSGDCFSFNEADAPGQGRNRLCQRSGPGVLPVAW